MALSLVFNPISGVFDYVNTNAGTVTSVALADASSTPIYTVSGSPITSAGTLTLTLNTEVANTVFSGPSSGSNSQPTFRTLVAADIPNLASTYVTQSEVASPNGVASLDPSGKIPASQLPSTVLEYQGLWDPSTNTPVLQDITGTAGYVYQVSVAYAGPIVGLSNPTMVNFQVGNLVIYSSAINQWEQTTPAAGVQYVNGAQGNVTVNAINQLTGDGTAGPASQSQSEVFTLATVNSNVGSFTNASITVNAKGLVTAASNGTAPVTTVTATSPLFSSGGTTPNLTIQQADTSQDGYLSSVDWNTFNNKQSALTFGNLTDSTSSADGITITGGTGAVIGSGTAIAQLQSSATQSGYLSSTDWTTFNSKASSGSYITALTGDVTASGPGSAVATLTATTNATITTLSALSLPTSQLSGTISLTSQVSGILPSANGGTGINNAGTLTYGSNNLAFVTSGPTSLTLPTSGTVIVYSNGDIAPSSAALANNQSSPADVTGLAFSTNMAKVQYSIVISATSSLYEAGEMLLVNIGGTGWQIALNSVGNSSGVVFSINSSGQVQYTSANYPGLTSAIVYFRAWAL